MAKKELKKLEIDSSVNLLMDHGIDVNQRTLYMWDRHDMEESASNVMDHSISLKFIKGIQLLSRESNEMITVLINSSGGSVTDGYAMYDAMRACKCKVRAIVTGACMSAATMVLCGAEERVAHKNAVIMIHDGSPGSIGFTTRDSEAWIAYGKKERYNYYKLLAESSKMPAKFWEKMCASDKIFFPVEAMHYGLIDRIVPHKPRKQLITKASKRKNKPKS